MQKREEPNKRRKRRHEGVYMDSWQFPMLAGDSIAELLADYRPLTDCEMIEVRASNARMMSKLFAIMDLTHRPGFTLREHAEAMRAEIARQHAAGGVNPQPFDQLPHAGRDKKEYDGE